MLIRKIILVSILVFSIFFIGSKVVFAAETTNLGGLDATAGAAGYESQNQSPASQTLLSLVGVVLNTVLSFLGIVFFCFVFWGGFEIIGAGGDEEVVTKGKKWIKNGAVGILIVLCCFFLSKAFVGFATGEGFLFKFK